MLPGSSRTFLERVESTPFLGWLAPQFGLIEIVGLILYVAAALYGAGRLQTVHRTGMNAGRVETRPQPGQTGRGGGNSKGTTPRRR